MSSIQEDIARVRESVAAHDNSLRSQHERVVADHERILAEHEHAIREHERQMRDHRSSLGSHRRHKRRKGESHENQTRVPGMKFRFKHSGHNRVSKESRSRTHSRHTDDKMEETSERDHGSEQGADTASHVEAFTAHPFVRPSASPPYLDPSIGDEQEHRPKRKPSATPQAEDAPEDPDHAFRTSLFDALEDDEGAAAYWEGVYGDPIHVYPRPGVSKSEDNGELEAMNDDEYAEYVKRKMWERKNPHLVREMRLREERERQKAEEKGRQKDWRRRTEEDRPKRRNDAFMQDVDEALARGSKRKENKRWRKAWDLYVTKWGNIEAVNSSELSGQALKDAIPWPVESGSVGAVSKDNVEAFFGMVPLEESETKVTRLKTERFRWHPDKIQHRFGGANVDADTLQIVTSIFQTIDELWLAEKRKNAPR